MKFKRIHINIERKIFLPDRTIGWMKIAHEYLDTDLKTWRSREYDPQGHFVCYTMEPAVCTGPKVPGKTAIPAGTYQCVITHSKRFQRPLPLILNVPGFEGVRIHGGNRPEDTQGCILVAFKHDEKSNIIYQNATSKVIEYMTEDYNEATLTIINKR